MNIFLRAKEEVSHQIKGMQKVIQNEYPKFQRSKKFEEFENSGGVCPPLFFC